MACFRSSVRSRVLGMDTTINVIIPYDHYSPDGAPGHYDKVLYLLHGLKQNADAWQRMSSAECYANYYGYVIIMPEVQRSFYTDMAYGPRYFTYITEELPEIVQTLFRIPNDPARTFAGGLSMGGYGALKCALQCPDRYAGAISLSSGFYTLNTPEMLKKAYYPGEELKGVLGPELACGPLDDLDARIGSFPKDIKKPRLYLACGTEDFLYQNNLRMRDSLLAGGFDVCYEEWPGAHDWRFWNVGLEKGMVYMAEAVK